MIMRQIKLGRKVCAVWAAADSIIRVAEAVLGRARPDTGLT
jgi:hypothetical protein